MMIDTSTCRVFTDTWKWQKNRFLTNYDQVVQSHLYCILYHLNLFLARKKLFWVEWIFALSFSGCLMWSLWWLWWHVRLVEFSCLSSLTRYHKVSQHYCDILNNINIFRCIDSGTFSHFDVIETARERYYSQTMCIDGTLSSYLSPITTNILNSDMEIIRNMTAYIVNMRLPHDASRQYHTVTNNTSIYSTTNIQIQ